MKIKFLSHITATSRFKKCFYFIIFACVAFMLLYASLHTSNMLVLRTGECKIPRLDPWDDAVTKYRRKIPPIMCANKSSLLFVDQMGYLRFNETALSEYSLPSLKCAYHVIRRYGDADVTLDKAVVFEPPVFVQDRVFRVLCNNNNSEVVYDFVHVNVAWNDTSVNDKHIDVETDEHLSIIFIGLDSVARSHAIRDLPLTYNYLKDTLGAYDFEGYMKLGKNSFPNLMPLLTGEESDSLQHTLFTLDNSNFIWKDGIMKNYATHYSEDRPEISTFNFIRRGFTKPPVDYYFRPYSLAMHVTEPIIIDKLGRSSWDCYGNKQHLLLQVDFLKRFISKYNGRLKFAYFWHNQMSHEQFSSLQNGDKPMLELLTWLHEGGHLNRAVLIVASDHGFRLGGYSTTHTGRLENNMPFLAIRVPKILLSKYPWIRDNLSRNTKRLTSSYDIHETMLDLIHYDFKTRAYLPVQTKGVHVPRSLFSEIPGHRTCKDAGIPPNYCTCFEMQRLNTSSYLVQYLAENVTDTINNLLINHSNVCHKLYLKNVTEASVVYSARGDDDHMPIKQSKSIFERLMNIGSIEYTGRYELLLYTGPNNALFKATLDYEERSEDGERNLVKLVGKPDRLDRYGDQSLCVKATEVEEYCYCK